MKFHGRAEELILDSRFRGNDGKCQQTLAIIGALGGLPMIIGLYVWLQTLRENDNDSED